MKSIQNVHWNGLHAILGALPRDHREVLEKVRERLEKEVRQTIYLSEREVTALIRVEAKTLMNDRARSGKGRYPLGFRLGGSPEVQYVRQDVLDWLAYEESTHRIRRVHRCR